MRIGTIAALTALMTFGGFGSPGADAQPSTTTPSICEGEALAARLSALFPPAGPAERLQNAQDLGACPAAAVQGALVAALRTEPEAVVRAALATSIGKLTPSPFTRVALAQAQRDPHVLVRARVEHAIAAQDKTTREQAAREHAAAEAQRERAQAEAASPPVAVASGATNEAVAPPDPARVAAPAVAASPQPPPSPYLSPPVPEPPAASTPPTPASGVPLLITTSLIAGGTWGAGLSVMADQNTPGVMLLLGSAGAVIGGGTAFALSRFGVRPSVEQAIWFSNATAWGSLAGLMAYAGSGANDARLQAGLLVGGESLGLALGAWSASRYRWRIGQTAAADGLVIASALTVMGLGRMDGKDTGIPAWMGYGTGPLMLGAAALSQHLSLTRADLRLMALAAAATSATLGLAASGVAGTSFLQSSEGQGGLIAGLGLGWLAGTFASPWVEPTPQQLKLASAAWLAGAGFGLGAFMVAFPDQADAEHRNLGAALGAVSFIAAGSLLGSRLHIGPNAVPMAFAGAAAGAGLWTLATGAGGDFLTDDQHAGGALSLAVAGGIAGALTSRHFRPVTRDYVTAAAATLAGASGGYGVTAIASSHDGGATFAGVLLGGAAGLTAGAWANHRHTMRNAEVVAALAGGAYGWLFAGNVSGSHDSEGRLQTGAQYLGLSLGVFGATAAARATDATTGQVLVPSVAAGLGFLVGSGAGALADGDHGSRIAGTTTGLTFAAASLLVDQKLKLSQGLDRAAWPAALWGGALGGFQGLLFADMAESAREGRAAPASGLVAGTAAGVAAGLVLSKLAAPTARDYVFTASGSLVGLSLGAGLSGAFDADATAASALRAGGSLAGLVSAATLAHFFSPTKVDLVAQTLGAGYGAALGTLAASLAVRDSDRTHAQQTGAQLGLAVGAMGAFAATHALGSTPGQVATATTGTALATMAGTGLGLALSEEGDDGPRLGATLGLSLGLLTSVAADRAMGFSRTGFGPRVRPALAGAALGAYQGLLLGRALAYDSANGESEHRQRMGGLLFGSAAGIATGLLLSNTLAPSGVDIVVTGVGSAVGSALGTGAAWVLQSKPGAADGWSTLAGSMAGMFAAGSLQRHAPMTGADAAAAGLGVSLGALVGAYTPSLHLRSVTTSDRLNAGGALLGAGAGSVLGVIIRKATHAQMRTVGMAAWGGVHGTLTGLSVGALVDANDAGTRGARMGAVAGGVGGTAVGALLWKHAQLSDAADRHTVVAASVLGGWSGWWAARLLDSGPEHEPIGIVAGAGVASMLALSAAPFIHVDDDVLLDAGVMNVLVGGAAGGVAAMMSNDERAQPAAVLAGGAAGLLLGSVMHERLTLASQSAPLLTLSVAQGALTGFLLPSLLHGDERNDRDEAAAMAAATLGGATVGLVLTSVVKPSASTAAIAGLGSATGAAIGGGIGLVSDDIGTSGGAALTLAGGALGLTAGAIAGRGNMATGSTFKASAVGAAIGVAEGAVFTWASRGTTADDYKGSMLVGAGIGSTLALASMASETWQIPASVGFGAWGAWIGSFSGALVQRSPQEVTLGGLIGLHAGMAAGYGALTAKWVEPGDFGWLSLFGAAGTLVGGASGALFSTEQDPQPAFVGLAVGPIAGLAVGALMLPTWRRLRGPERKTDSATSRAGSLAQLTDGVEGSPPARGPIAEWAHGTKRKLSTLIEVDEVMPLVGAMPTDGQSGTPAPFVLGLSGKWR